MVDTWSIDRRQRRHVNGALDPRAELRSRFTLPHASRVSRRKPHLLVIWSLSVGPARMRLGEKKGFEWGEMVGRLHVCNVAMSMNRGLPFQSVCLSVCHYPHYAVCMTSSPYTVHQHPTIPHTLCHTVTPLPPLLPANAPAQQKSPKPRCRGHRSSWRSGRGAAQTGGYGRRGRARRRCCWRGTAVCCH